MRRKGLAVFLAVWMVVLAITGCGNSSAGGAVSVAPIFEEKLETVMEAMFEKIEDVDTKEFVKTFGIGTIDAENAEYYLGSAEVDFTEGVYAEPLMSSIAFSICLVRVNTEADMDEQKKLIEDGVDPRKWICVEAESVKTESIGDVLLLVMADKSSADAVEQAFEALNEQ